jgi:DNA-binding HxlR family transcriptional regulator
MRYGIVRRTVFGEKPPVEVEYALTGFGRRFIGILEEVRRLQAALDQGMVSEAAGEIRKGKARRRNPTER